MKKIHIVTFAAVALIAAVIVGCASTATTMFNTEQLAVDGASTATHTFNLYLASATNGANSNRLAQLLSERDSLYAADKDVASTAEIAEQFRQEYATNANATNQANWELAIEILAGQSSNVTQFVKTLTTTPQP